MIEILAAIFLSFCALWIIKIEIKRQRRAEREIQRRMENILFRDWFERGELTARGALFKCAPTDPPYPQH